MISGIIQARTGSSRLPNKIMMELGGGTVLEHLVKQIRASDMLEQYILTTSDHPRDDVLAVHAETIGLHVYRGDEQKIMSRLKNAAVKFNAGIVVRLLGDCPLSDPEMIDSYVEKIQSEPDLDMVTNQNPHSFPDGYDISVIRLPALQRLCMEFDANGQDEHMSGFWKPESGYKVLNMTAPENYFSRFRMTLDYAEDLDAIRRAVDGLQGGGRVLYLRDVVAYLEAHPEIVAINGKYLP
ncbi:MAG TPA: NTP transferase domain-containing protein [Micavibrio sp.]|jgi:spore coat polysaccharide biosynthesis protein SpsF